MRQGANILVIAIFIPLLLVGCATTAYWQGNDRLQRGDNQGAVEALTLAIEKDPLNFGALLNRGIAYERLGQLEKTIQDYNRAIELVPNFGRAYHYRGHVYAKMNQYELAVENYDQALKLGDAVQIDAQGQIITIDKVAIHYDRGNSLFQLKKYEQAIASYDNAIAINPRFADAYNNRGVVYLELGNKNAACVDRVKACELGIASSCKWTKANCSP